MRRGASRPVNVAVPYSKATNRSTVVACSIQSTRSGTDVPVMARLPAIPDWAWLGRGSVEATKASRSVSPAGIACQTLSIVLAMIVVAAMAIANGIITTTLEPGDVRSVRIACWIEITTASERSKLVPACRMNPREFRQVLDGADSSARLHRPQVGQAVRPRTDHFGSGFQVPGSTFVF